MKCGWKKVEQKGTGQVITRNTLKIPDKCMWITANIGDLQGSDFFEPLVEINQA